MDISFQLSSSLKERLKKCGRYHASPKVLTPVADQVESSHTSPAAKRLCSSEHNETTNPADDGSCVASFTTPDSKLKSRNDNIAHCDNFFKVVEPPSELQQNISASSGGRRTSKMETDRNRNSVGHKMAGEKSVTSWTVGSSLNSRSTPVSSRSQTRTNMKVNKLDFEKETERTKCVLATQIKFQTKSLDVATKVEETFEATNSAVKQINKGENNRSQSLIEDSCSLNKKDSDAESNYTEKQRLLKEIDEKEETLRKLKMVKMYRTKVGMFRKKKKRNNLR